MYVCVFSYVQVLQLHGVCQAPLSVGFLKQEYCSRLPFPTPGDLPHPGKI